MVMMFLMPIITSILILTRSIFGIGSISVQELVMYFHATIFMLGIAYTLKHNRHVSIDIFYNSFSTKTKERIIKLGYLIFIIPFILIIHSSCISQEKKDEYWQKKLSKEQYYVNEFANKYFSGGGHKYAAGGMSELSIDDTINKLKSLIPELF